MYYIFWLLFSLIGASIGSFLNVIVDRLPKGENLIIGRSHCDYCKHILKWYELIPVISFVFQRGQTRCCNRKMSYQYLFSEIFTGFITVFVMWSFWVQSNANLVSLVVTMILVYALFVISMIDIKHGEISIETLYFLLVVFVLWQGYLLVDMQDFNIWLLQLTERILSALAASSFFAVLHFGTRGKGMGGGDVQLAFLLGLFLSAIGTLVGVYLSFMIGGFFAVMFLLLGKRKIGQTVPFGPYMACGAFIALLWGGAIIRLYLTYGNML